MVVVKNYKPDHVDFHAIDEIASIDLSSFPANLAKASTNCPHFNKAIRSSKGESFHKKSIDEMLKLEQHVAQDVFTGLLKKIFQGKAFEGLQSFTTWRLTEMKDMDYHSDIYEAASLRCFYNLSSSKRKWRLGHHTFDIFQHLSREKKLQINEILSTAKHERYIKAAQPTVMIGQREINLLINKITEDDIVEPLFDWEFDKYDLWIIDGRKAVHKPIWGDKLVAFDYGFLGSNLHDLRDSSLCYPKWISEKIQFD